MVKFRFLVACCVLAVACLSAAAASTPAKAKPERRNAAGADGLAEARLIDVYKLIGAGRTRDALPRAEALVRDFPNFQLAQLVHGDLLSLRTRPVAAFGDVSAELAKEAGQNMQDLRSEAVLRVAALKHRPPPGAIPKQFLKLSSWNKHAIAVDVSKARLYLFENRNGVIRLTADYYISIGKAGFGKSTEGDQRTPLGLYFITSNLDPKRLKDLYGAGALPINYPNAYDIRRGRTGGGIWLHGTPSSQFSRAPQATDGCVAVANPDLLHIIKTVEIRSTPVLIAQSLSWVSQQALGTDRMEFEALVENWRKARVSGDLTALSKLYAADFSAEGIDLAAYQQQLRNELGRLNRRAIRLENLSVLGWSDDAAVRVVTFVEVVSGLKSGRTFRQYWERRGSDWRVVYETAFK